MNWIPVFWVSLGVLLLIFEVLGAAGFLLGAAIVAIAMALITWAIDISMPVQFVMYAVASVLSTVIYYRFFRRTQPENEDVLPSRSEQMVGTRFELEEALEKGEETRVQLGDTLWRVTTDSDLGMGTEVEVVAADTMLLTIRAID